MRGRGGREIEKSESLSRGESGSYIGMARGRASRSIEQRAKGREREREREGSSIRVGEKEEREGIG